MSGYKRRGLCKEKTVLATLFDSLTLNKSAYSVNCTSVNFNITLSAMPFNSKTVTLSVKAFKGFSTSKA